MTWSRYYPWHVAPLPPIHRMQANEYQPATPIHRTHRCYDMKYLHTSISSHIYLVPVSLAAVSLSMRVPRIYSETVTQRTHLKPTSLHRFNPHKLSAASLHMFSHSINAVPASLSVKARYRIAVVWVRIWKDIRYYSRIGGSIVKKVRIIMNAMLYNMAADQIERLSMGPSTAGAHEHGRYGWDVRPRQHTNRKRQLTEGFESFARLARYHLLGVAAHWYKTGSAQHAELLKIRILEYGCRKHALANRNTASNPNTLTSTAAPYSRLCNVTWTSYHRPLQLHSQNALCCTNQT